MSILLVFLLVAMTIFCWSAAIYGLTNEKFNKDIAQAILALIFWPIGLVVLVVMGFSKLLKTAFGEEE